MAIARTLGWRKGINHRVGVTNNVGPHESQVSADQVRIFFLAQKRYLKHTSSSPRDCHRELRL